MLEVFRNEVPRLTTTEPKLLLKEYIQVLTQQTTPAQFAQNHLSPEKQNEENSATLLSLLEGQKYRLYMFTSCGWFFADIAGIEPVQNIRYALKALSLYNSFTTKNLYNLLSADLETALSNQKSEGSGQDILEREAHLGLSDGIEAASYFFIRRLIYRQEKPRSQYGYFTLLDMQEISKNPLTANLHLIDPTRQQNFKFEFKAETNDVGSLNITVKNLLTSEAKEYIEDLSQLPLELRQNLTNYLVSSTETAIAENSAQTFEDIRFAVTEAANLGTEIPPVIRHSAEIAVTTLLHRRLQLGTSVLSEAEIGKVEDILLFSARYSIKIEAKRITNQLTQLLWTFFEQLKADGCMEECAYMVRLINALRLVSIEPDFTIPQKVVFAQLNQFRKKLVKKQRGFYKEIDKNKLSALSSKEKEKLEMVLKLCQVMSIYADDITRVFYEPEEP